MGHEAMTAEDRLTAAIALEPTDRVVCGPLMGQYPGRFLGITNAEFMWNFDKIVEAHKKLKSTYPIWDAAEQSAPYAPAMSVTGIMRSRFPGRDLPDDVEYQHVEFEAMSVDDYNIIINEGLGAYMAKFFMVSHQLTPEQFHEGTILSDKVTQDLGKLITESGQAPLWAILGGVPADLLCMARGFMNFCLDLFDEPELVEKAILKAAEDSVQMSIDSSKSSGCSRVMLGGGRSNPKMLGKESFERFTWPGLEKSIYGLIDAGLVPCLHLDSYWDGAFEYLKTLPKGKVLVELDGFTDIFAAKEYLGGNCCLMGDVPSTIFAFGTRDEMDAYCKKLIKEVGKGGGFIFSSGCSIPFNANHENVKTFFECAEKYGFYN